jgi:hypothetical protein
MTGLWYAYPGNTLTTATNSLPLLMYVHTHTCDVCSKSLRISLQLNDLLHTPQVHGHSSQHTHRFILINIALILQTFTIKQKFCTCFLLHQRLLFHFYRQMDCYVDHIIRWASVLTLCCCGFCFMDFFTLHSFHQKDYICKVQDRCTLFWVVSNVWYFELFVKFFWIYVNMYCTVQHRICCSSMECKYMLANNLLQKALSCEVREVAFLK